MDVFKSSNGIFIRFDFKLRSSLLKLVYSVAGNRVWNMLFEFKIFGLIRSILIV